MLYYDDDDDQKYVSLKTDFYVLSPQECCLAHPLQPGCCRADRLSDNMITFIMMLHDTRMMTILKMMMMMFRLISSKELTHLSVQSQGVSSTSGMAYTGNRNLNMTMTTTVASI